MPNNTRTALITGAAGGIGRSLVQVFSDAGYLTIATDCLSQPVDMPCATYIQADLEQFSRDESYGQKVLSDIRAALPEDKLDVLVNNAAIQILAGSDELKREDWQATLGINLLAPFLLTQGLLKELEKGHGGVVNIGSIHARLTKKNFVAYATSKAALAGLTKAMAVDLGPRIRINAIEPAAIETEMLRAGFEGDPESFAKLSDCHPQLRIGFPEEVARLVLASVGDGMGFLHGACIALDGGISSRLFDPD